MEPHMLIHATEAMRRYTGVVIPVYFSAAGASELERLLLADNVRAYVQQVDDPGRICLSVDGAAHGRDIAEGLADDYGVLAV